MMNQPMMRSLCFLLLLIGTAASRHLCNHCKLVQASNLADRIPDQYIIVFDNNIDDVDSKVGKLTDMIPGFSIQYKYHNNVKGVSIGQLPEWYLGSILDDSDVIFVKEVQIY